MASESLPVTRCRALHLCAPLWCCSGRNSVHSPRRTDVTVGLARCHVTHKLSAETKDYSSSLKQGKIFPRKLIESTQPVPSLSLGKEVFQAQGPFPCSSVEVERLHAGDCLSQQSKYWKREDKRHCMFSLCT